MVSMEFKTMRMKNLINFSEHRVDQVHDSIGGEHVKGDHASLPGGRLHGDVPAPGHVDLLAASGLHGGGAFRHVAGLESGSRDNVAEENSGEGVLVSQQAVESLLRDLGKGVVGGGEHCEGSLPGEGVHKTGSLDSSQEGGELRGGDRQLGDVLRRGGLGPGAAVVATSGGAGDEGEAGEADQGLHNLVGGGFFALWGFGGSRELKSV